MTVISDQQRRAWDEFLRRLRASGARVMAASLWPELSADSGLPDSSRGGAA